MRILGCASQGTGSTDELRLRELLREFETSFVPFDRSQKRASLLRCLSLLRKGDFDLFALEGTGIAAGLAAILSAVLWKRPYVVSSGDAVGPFLSAGFPLGSPVFNLYERCLYSFSKGFIGWTPYLVGRALTMGARRGVTAPGWSPFTLTPSERKQRRLEIRSKLGLPLDAVVFGMAGSLIWSPRFGYCYGSELVRAARLSNSSAIALIVGDGSGLPHLKELAGDLLQRRIFLTGRVPRVEVAHYLAAMDVGSLPQSVDAVGGFRYTTKLPEYHSAGLLVATNQIPMAYDLDRLDILRLPGQSPWSNEFVHALAAMMSSLDRKEIETRKAAFLPSTDFDREIQIARVTAFLSDLLPKQGGPEAEHRRAPRSPL